MFAAISEISGVLVLPSLETDNQQYFLWFLMLFPSILVLLFFAILNWNHKVLYAPSDFNDENNFFKSITKNTNNVDDKIKKLSEEAAEIKSAESSYNLPKNQQTENEPNSIDLNFKNFELLEELAFSKILEEFPGNYFRGMSFGSGSSRYLFDAIIERPENEILLVEMKIVINSNHLQPLGKAIERMIAALSEPIPTQALEYKRAIIIGVITKENSQDSVTIKNFIDKKFDGFEEKVLLRIFSIQELQTVAFKTLKK